MKSARSSNNTCAPPTVIVFVDAAGQQTAVPVAEVAVDVAFLEIGGQRVPVARVVAQSEPHGFVVRSYAADGSVLRSTVMPSQPQSRGEQLKRGRRR